jgi:flagellar basal-body rod protein FlgC
MDYRAVFEVAAAGMSLEKRRLDVAALNLANVNASVPAGQAPYAPQRVVAKPVYASFTASMGQAEGRLQTQAATRQVDVLASDAAPRLVNDPGHPHADAKGMVSYPGVNHASEMLSVLTAVRAYEANVAVASMAKAMAAKALEIGGR